MLSDPQDKPLMVGCANQKFDIFKSTIKLLSCVGVGLIKKTLEWQQILAIPSSENILKYVKTERFLFAVFCSLIHLDQYSHPSFMRSSTPTRKHR